MDAYFYQAYAKLVDVVRQINQSLSDTLLQK